MINIDEESYLFIIDTDSYAGNFERQLTAYITGRCGECEVGSEIAIEVEEELYEFEEQIDNLIANETDDNGYFRICSIWPSDSSDMVYNSVAIFLTEYPVDYMIDLFTERAKSFNDYIKKTKEKEFNYLSDCGNIIGFRILKKVTKYETVKGWKN